MKNTTKYLILFSISVMVVFAACNTEDVDTVKPIVTIVEPLDHAVFHPGSVIHLDFELSDNVGLRQYKVDIHFGEGHQHKALAATPAPWVFDSIGNIDGLNRHLHMDIAVPADAPLGEYHLLVFATDLSGNEAFKAIEIKIQLPI